jgi:hypothetical protein
MPSDRLEAEIEKLGKRVKDLDMEMAREEVYRDAARCQRVLADRERTQADLERHEEEWLRRAE